MIKHEPEQQQKGKTVAIIGSGVAGILTAKCCLDQSMRVTVFEQSDRTGGLWRYRENGSDHDRDIRDDHDEDQNKQCMASVMRSTVLNTSKEMSAISNFPPPAEYPNYMHHSLMADYLDKYCATFDFEKYVRFRHECISVDMAPDHARTGRWIVSFRDLTDTFGGKDAEASIKRETFDCVAICTGHNNVRHIPSFPGQDTFTGQILHSRSVQYAHPNFAGKRVAVIGIGNSAVDVAVELSNVTKQVYLSTRRGSWIQRRVGRGGRPIDLNITRFSSTLMSQLPSTLVNNYLERQVNDWFDHEMYRLKPAHRLLGAQSTLSDTLPYKILCGSIRVRGSIRRFTPSGVVFESEPDSGSDSSLVEHETECDTVIFATGYRISFPMLSPQIVSKIIRSDSYDSSHSTPRVRLYRLMFVPDELPHSHTLAFIGLAKASGPLMPLFEMQARYFALLNNDRRLGRAPTLVLPPAHQQIAQIESSYAQNCARFYGTARHALNVNWLGYMDELAGAIGCRPPAWWRVAFADVRLFYHLYFAPAFPYQYRLVGPDAWSGARNAILTAEQRIDAPFRRSDANTTANETAHTMAFCENFFVKIILCFICAILLLFLLLFFSQCEN